MSDSFDTIIHTIFTTNLENIGVSNSLLHLMTSYMTDRTYKIQINNIKSEE